MHIFQIPVSVFLMLQTTDFILSIQNIFLDFKGICLRKFYCVISYHVKQQIDSINFKEELIEYWDAKVRQLERKIDSLYNQISLLMRIVKLAG